MPQGDVQIIRDQCALGSLPATDALELLKIGFFVPDDLYWREGMGEPRPLSELAESPALAKGPSKSWRERARQSVTGMADALVSSAGGVAGRLKSLAIETPAAVTLATNKMLEAYLPQIRTLLASANSRAVQAIKDGVQNDEMMRKTFGAAYDCLPRPICRFVSEDRFIAFCQTHRNRLLGPAETGEKGPHESAAASTHSPEPDS